jgi:hypothetical protein
MTINKICKLSDKGLALLILKVLQERGEKDVTFYGWQWDVLPDIYARIALLLFKKEDLEEDLKEKIATIHRMLARLLHHTYEAWIACSAVTDITQNYFEDLVEKQQCDKDKLISFVDTVLNEIEDAYRKCDYYVKQSVMESKTILEKIDYISMQPKLIGLGVYDLLLDVYDWIAVNYADMEYLSKAFNNIYNEIINGLKDARDELISTEQQSEAQKKEEKKKEGGE